MKKLALNFILAALATGSALAADLPSRKEPLEPPPAPPLWSGFYVGLNAGAAWGSGNTAQWSMYPAYLNPNSLGAAANAQASAIVGGPQLSLGSQLGFIGGGQAGYSYQFSRSFVAGVEADIQGAAGARGAASSVQALNYVFNSSATLVPTPSIMTATNSVARTLNYLGTVRGRIGYLVTPGLQVYGTGGLAYGGVGLSTFAWQQSATNLQATIGPGGNSISDASVGWAAGGGIEWLFAPAWSVRAEYLYYDLGAKRQFAGAMARQWLGAAPSQTLSGGDILSLMSTNVSTRLNGNIARVGVNYHFNIGGSAPVLASF